jgi:DNA-directed RNA polymerase specialized sigma24 family protein
MNAVIAWIAAEQDRGDETAGALPEVDAVLDRSPDLWLYRDRTVAMLRRYLRYSLETGRLPSLLGCEFFRTTVTSYSVTTFEDRVVFVHDVETCLQRLDDFSRQVIARVVLQEHSHEAAARLLHCSRKTIQRKLQSALDELSEIFLAVALLLPAPGRPEVR